MGFAVLIEAEMIETLSRPGCRSYGECSRLFSAGGKGGVDSGASGGFWGRRLYTAGDLDLSAKTKMPKQKFQNAGSVFCYNHLVAAISLVL
jgi:hypothetical protein